MDLSQLRHMSAATANVTTESIPRLYENRIILNNRCLKTVAQLGTSDKNNRFPYGVASSGGICATVINVCTLSLHLKKFLSDC